MKTRLRYEVGVANGQLIHKHGDGETPLVNIVDSTNRIVGGVFSKPFAQRIVELLNADNDRGEPLNPGEYNVEHA